MRAAFVVSIVLTVPTLTFAALRSADDPAANNESQKLRAELQAAQARIASLEAEVKLLRRKLAEKAQSNTSKNKSDPFRAEQPSVALDSTGRERPIL